MLYTSKHDKGTSPSFNLTKEHSNITERLHAAADRPQSAIKHTGYVVDKSGITNVNSVDRFMEDKTDSKILEQGRKDQKGT